MGEKQNTKGAEGDSRTKEAGKPKRDQSHPESGTSGKENPGEHESGWKEDEKTGIGTGSRAGEYS